MKPERVLIVAAHPDDEVLGCGATTARHSSQGDQVWTLILGEGVASRKGISAQEKKRQIKRLWANSQKANDSLGVKRLIQKAFPDNRFDSVPLLDIVQAIEAVVQEFRPSLIYTHSAVDLNHDHRITHDAVKTACRPMSTNSVKALYAFEVPSSTEWRFDASATFQPTTFVEVSDFLPLKLKALGFYDTEMRAYPHPRSKDYIQALAKVRGGQSCLLAAEAFSLIRQIRP